MKYIIVPALLSFSLQVFLRNAHQNDYCKNQASGKKVAVAQQIYQPLHLLIKKSIDSN